MTIVRRIPLILHGWLALCLALAPLFPAHALPADAPAPATIPAMHMDAHDAHAGHAMHGDQNSAQSDCATPGDCRGSCCSACGQCAGLSVVAPDRSLDHKTTLTPREPRFFSFVYLPLRERPPRHFTA